MAGLDFRILGTLEVHRDGEGVTPSAPRQRALLADLLIHFGEPVSVDRLIDDLWGEDPPPAAKNSLQSTISNVRAALEPDRAPGAESVIRTTPAGYVLDGDGDRLDAVRFESLLEGARMALPTDPAGAAALATEALGLWRGPALAEFAYEEFAQEAVRRLEELRLVALETRIEAELALGDHAAVLGELERLVDQYPLREGLRSSLMVALSRAGRQADALRVADTGRRELAEIGLEPGAVLRELEQRILEQDPSLGAPAAADRRSERPNPYKGLQAFGEDDAADFFGREALVAEILAEIADAGPGGFTAVVGPSGSGKSSVVNAGVLPALRAGALGGAAEWLICRMYPGSHPFEELEAAMLTAAPDAPTALLDMLTDEVGGLRRAARLVAPGEEAQLLVVIDQFEELFTLAPAEERRRFVRMLGEALSGERPALRVVVTLRSDFLGEALSFPTLVDLLKAGTVLVGPMGAAELEEAVTGPARRVGVEVDASLVAAAVADVEGNAGALPLLQHALTQTFERRTSDVMTHTDYAAVGGVAGAVAQTAAAALDSLPAGSQEHARQVLLRLVSPGEGAVDTRRRAVVEDLRGLAPDPAGVDAVLAAFGDARLLTFDVDAATSERTVEIAHEALLVEWPQLKRWIDGARSDIEWERRLHDLAGEWEAAGRADGYLLGGSRLSGFTAWRDTSDLRLDPAEAAFLDESIAAENGRRRQQTRRRRLVFAVLSIAAVLSASLAFLAVRWANQAESDARLARAGTLASASVDALEVDPDLAVLLAIEAVQVEAMPRAIESLHRGVQSHRLLATLPAEGRAGGWIDADRVALLQGDGMIEIFDVNDGASAVQLGSVPGFQVQSNPFDVPVVSASPDGDRLAVGLNGGTAQVWNLAAGSLERELRVNESRPAVAWHPDGQLLAVRAGSDVDAVTRGFIVDVGSGATVAALPECIGCPWHAEYDRAGRLWLYVDPPGSAEVALVPHTLTEGEVIADFASGEAVLFDTFRPPFAVDRGRLAIPSSGSAGLVSSRGTGVASVEHGAPIWDLDLATGQRLISGGGDGRAVVWDLVTGTPEVALTGHDGAVTAVAFSPGTGPRALTVGIDGTARVWDVLPSAQSEVATVAPTVASAFRAHFTGVDNVAIIQDGQWEPLDLGRLRGMLGDLTARVDLTTGETSELVATPVTRLSVDPASGLVVGVPGFHAPQVGEEIVTVLPGGEPRRVSLGAGAPYAVAIDGQEAAFVACEGAAGYQSSCRGSVLAATHAVVDGSVASSPTAQVELGAGYPLDVRIDDGRLVTVVVDRPIATTSARLIVWAAGRGGRIAEVEVRDDVTVFGAGAGHVAVGDAAGGVAIYRLDDVGFIREQDAHSGPITAVAIDSAARRFATGSIDGSVRLWDLDSGDSLYTILSGSDRVVHVEFSADGSQLLVLHPNGLIKILTLDVDALLAIAADKVNRGLTDDECTRYLGTDGCE